jgi:DNA-binding transcriptional regulator YhcF (GntR family)
MGIISQADKANSCLKSEIEKAKDNKRSLLPSIRQLAGLAGVSVGTMGLAVKRMEQCGEVQTITGTGVFISPLPYAFSPRPPSTHPLASGSGRNRWYETYLSLREDIQKGLFQPEISFPAVKQLSERYGVAPRTLRKALKILERENVIYCQKRRYRIPEPERILFHNSIVMVTCSISSFHIDLNRSRMNENFISLERECVSRGLRLVVVMHRLDNHLFYYNGKTVKLDEGFIHRFAVLGFVLWTTGASSENMDLSWRSISRTGLPVAIFAEGDTGGFSTRVPSKNSAVFVSGISGISGNVMGRYLKAGHHQHIAYISPEFHLPAVRWTVTRYNGILETFTDMTNQNTVTLVSCREPGSLQKDSGDAVKRSLLVELRASVETAKQLRAGKYFSDTTVIEYENRSAMILSQMEQQAIVKVLLDEALSKKQITAWVCQNDEIAFAALNVCIEQGIRVPQDISIMGFDDSEKAHAYRITSYNFNHTAVARAMICFILKEPNHFADMAQKKPLEIEGTVVERTSSMRLHE